MSMSEADRKAAGKELGRQLFTLVTKTADVDWDDLKAAIGAIDDRMDAVLSTLNQTRTVKQSLVDALPNPFASTTNAQEKSLALVIWAMKETGLI